MVSGKKLEAYRTLVRQAKERRDFLKEQADVGSIAPVEVVDNERSLAARQAKLATLELEFKRVGLKLGFYRRDEMGEPQPPQESEIPERSWWTLDPVASEAEIDAALERAPALEIFRTSLNVLEQELSLAKNGRLPELNLEVFGSRSFGEVRPYSAIDDSVTETTVGGKLSFAWEVQQRKARGQGCCCQREAKGDRTGSTPLA